MIDVENNCMEVKVGDKVEWRGIASWEPFPHTEIGQPRRPHGMMCPVPAVSERESVQWVIGGGCPCHRPVA